MPRFLAMRSAELNWSGVLSQGHSAGWKKPGPLITLAPRPTWLITSTPQAMPASIEPARTKAETMWLACWPEPHCVSTVVPPVRQPLPRESQATRVRLFDCSPACVTQPPTTCRSEEHTSELQSLRHLVCRL